MIAKRDNQNLQVDIFFSQSFNRKAIINLPQKQCHSYVPVKHSDFLLHSPWQLFQSWYASDQHEFHRQKTELDHRKET